MGKWGLNEQVHGPRAVVFGTPEWNAQKAELTPHEHVENALAKLRLLGSEPLEKLARMTWCTFPMKATPGFFEVRKGGVRFYGARLASEENRDVIILLGAEQKAGKRSADKRLLTECAARLGQLEERLAQERRQGRRQR